MVKWYNLIKEQGKGVPSKTFFEYKQEGNIISTICSGGQIIQD